MNGRVVAFCNRKGGVGKTTSAVSVADTLQSQFGKSVVLVDTDPQGSSSMALARDDMLRGGLASKFLERTLSGSSLDGRRIDLDAVVRRAVGRLTDRPETPMALVPISPAFWKYEIKVRKEVAFFSTTRTVAVRRFRRLMGELRREYDFTIIDTAPGVSMLFENIVRASDFLVIPCVPDPVSAWGLNLLSEELASMRGNPAPPARILWTQFNPNSNWQDRIRQDLEPLPFPYFTRGNEAPGGEAQEILGIGQYSGLPAAIANVEPRSWSALYSGPLGANLLRICEDMLDVLDGASE